MYDYLIFGLAMLFVLLAISQARLINRVHQLERKTRNTFEATQDALNKGKTAPDGNREAAHK
ncbi:hypothetical protein [Clostridium minihomine]|uniref:hypothetical protein n=1 Tax=Clostridium minihomine TaxID=2045012 RepID=UPI000C762714|nr:hypothetical protein [Clostridium minihomine]